MSSVEVRASAKPKGSISGIQPARNKFTSVKSTEDKLKIRMGKAGVKKPSASYSTRPVIPSQGKHENTSKGDRSQ